MFDLRPFQALRFNGKNVPSLDDVLTPPFDVIDPAQRAELAQRSPFNMVHVILPESTGASMVSNGVSMVRVSRGRSRVTS